MTELYTDEELIEALKEHPDLGIDKWKEKKIRPSATTIAKRFGSWNKARERAGLERRPSYADSKKTEDILNMVEEEGAILGSELKGKLNTSYLMRAIRRLWSEGHQIHKKKVYELLPSTHGSVVHHPSSLLSISSNDSIFWTDPDAVVDKIWSNLKFPPDSDDSRTKVILRKIKQTFPRSVWLRFEKKLFRYEEYGIGAPPLVKEEEDG